MRRDASMLAILICCLLFFSLSTVFAQETPTPSDVVEYIIQPGDTLFSIARRFNTTVTAIAQENGIANTSQINWGQRIRIPQPVQATPDGQTPPTATPSGATILHTVRAGEQLNQIATLYGTTVAELLRLNPQIANSNIIYSGQQLTVPAPAGEGAPAPSESLPATDSPATAAPQVTIETAVATPNPAYAIGLDVDASAAGGTDFSQISQLGINWIKQDIRWRDFETAPGEINFEALDAVINALEAQNANVLLTVTYAPDWARSIQEENGPPDNFANFGAFMSALAGRYAGRVAAYEIWNEPNLRSRWKSLQHPIGAESYIELLRHGYNAVKAADPAALVISAGLAPTGFNDAFNAEAGNLEVNAIDDRVFLANLYALGVAELTDGIGAHPMGWANPPEARCCEPAPGVVTHYEDEHFYFLDTLERYRQTMIDNGDAATAIWITKFGWGTYEGVDDPPSDANRVFIGYINQQQQAQYIARAFTVGSSLGYVGPMFVYNFNGCPATSVYDSSACFYSLTDANGSPRPAFAALAQAGSVSSSEPEATAPAAATPVPTISGEATAEVQPVRPTPTVAG